MTNVCGLVVVKYNLSTKRKGYAVQGKQRDETAQIYGQSVHRPGNGLHGLDGVRY